MVVFIPIGIMVFLVNSGIQSIRSSRRIRLHESGQAGIEVDSYRMPLLNGMRTAVEDVYENLNSAQENEYLAQGSEEEAMPESPRASRSQGSEKAASVNGSESSFDDALSHKQSRMDVPTLALAPYQFAMIQALDEVGFRKYPVHIQKVGHSHAAIIVRTEKPSFSEGHIVLRHWLDEEFLI